MSERKPHFEHTFSGDTMFGVAILGSAAAAWVVTGEFQKNVPVLDPTWQKTSMMLAALAFTLLEILGHVKGSNGE